MIRLRKLHLVVGVAGFVAFVLTGQYMYWGHAGLEGMADGPRMFFRSAHIFLLWSSLLNIGLGCYLRPLASVAADRLQRASSLLILAGPLLLGVSFFLETYTLALTRPVNNWAHFVAVGGVAGHGAALILEHFTVRWASKDYGSCKCGRSACADSVDPNACSRRLVQPEPGHQPFDRG